MTIRIGLFMAGAALTAVTPGCILEKNRQATVLESADFVADPTTTPTGRPADVPQAGAGGSEPAAVPVAEAPAVTVGGGAERPPAAGALGATDGAFDVSVAAGPPVLSGDAPEPVGMPVLVEAKVGEINGRPIRVQELLDEVGPRLEATARRRTLTRDDYDFFGFRYSGTGAEEPINRAQWLDFARAAFNSKLNGVLQDELLQAEARASLRPEQQMGLRYLVQEFAEQQRRESGGSQAELTRRLSEGGKTVEQAKREREILLLIQYQLDEKIRKRVRVSWKDVRLWYERNYELFNPPAKATFRMIQVPADNAEALARVQGALKGGTPFAEVAATADNAFEPAKGGLWGDQTFTGEYAEATLFSEPLNTLAQGLQPGAWGGPVDFAGARTFLYLDSVEQIRRPLSDRDVQLRIANVLNSMAFESEQRRYIERLKERASFSDLGEMTALLTEIAARRYWPE